jgi:hypothetical protein
MPKLIINTNKKRAHPDGIYLFHRVHVGSHESIIFDFYVKVNSLKRGK